MLTNAALQVDPITPYSNSQRVASMLDDKAVLVTQNGYGHTSLAEKSTCTLNTIKQYFIDGSVCLLIMTLLLKLAQRRIKLPSGNATQCEIDDDVVIFSKPSST